MVPSYSNNYTNRSQPPQRPAGGGNRGGGNDSLPTPTPVSYFEADKKTLKKELLDQNAIKWADSFKELKTSQMRRFYDDLKAIERKILMAGDVRAQEDAFKQNRALITMFKAKAVYAQKRKVSPREFTQFIFDHEASIKDLKDFKAFLKVFEAVVAFHRFYSRDN